MIILSQKLDGGIYIVVLQVQLSLRTGSQCISLAVMHAFTFSTMGFKSIFCCPDINYIKALLQLTLDYVNIFKDQVVIYVRKSFDIKTFCYVVSILQNMAQIKIVSDNF